MKATWKNILIAVTVLSMIFVVLVAIDSASDVSVASSKTYLRITVVDLDNKPVHNAQVTVGGKMYFTDNKGLSPTIELVSPYNSYDSTISAWYTANVTVKKTGYVPTAVFNCVVYSQNTRKLTVKIYPVDASDLPYVCYVESPPDDYIKAQLK